MPPSDWGAERKVARALAREAGRAVYALRRIGFGKRVKGDKSPVTDADMLSDHLIREGLHAAFPEDAILTEESERLGDENARRVWVVDPIDGTRAFIDGSRGYAIQIGLLYDGVPVLGVLYEPERHRLFEASGARLWTASHRDEPRRVRSERRRMGPPRLLTSQRMEVGRRLALATALGAASPVWAHSVGVKVGMLVDDEADIYISEFAVHYWDSLAPFAVLAAAGGRVTGFDGRPLNFDSTDGRTRHEGPFIATMGLDHLDICTTVARVIGASS